jgi:hypothetical protein
MSMHHDPDLDDVLQDDELLRLAALLRATRRAEPPLDEAFRTGLRRQLMKSAWEMSERRAPWWRRSTAPAPRAPALAWAGAAAGVLLIASVVVYMTGQPPGGLDITSPDADAHAVQLQQPILVSFNQPMDHKTTEAAVQITPATYVTFAWTGNTLAVQPTSGNLAPNTQYRVTIGPGAKTQSGQLLNRPKTITFVTQPSATPAPSPRPTVRPTPGSLLADEHRLAGLPSGSIYTPQWSADSSTIYLVGDNGALESVAVSGGRVKVIVPDGVSYPAISPAGDQLAYVRGGKIEVLTLATGSTAELAAAPRITTLIWARDQLLSGNSGGVYRVGVRGPSQVAATPRDAAIVSIAPDGAHAVYQQGHSLFVLDLATAKSTQFGPIAGTFLGWSPDGSRMLYTGTDGTVVADTLGQAIAKIPSGDPSWSSQGEILVGNDTALFAVSPDGSGQSTLSSGMYRLPVWAPNGTAFAFVRGAAVWSATTAPLAPPRPSIIDEASTVVNAFMNARLSGQLAQANTYLDANGRQSYLSNGLPLGINGDARFSRFYVLAREMTRSNPDTASFVVRLVLTQGPVDVSEYEETLTLQRDQASRQFLIHQATASQTRALGRGADVVAVEVSPGTIRIVFDSDLVPSTVAGGVVLFDGTGKRVGGASTYANRTVVITRLALVPGASYKLAVLTSVQDVGGRNVPSEFDLNFVGPSADSSAADQSNIVIAPSSQPSPRPLRSPLPLPGRSPAP